MVHEAEPGPDARIEDPSQSGKLSGAAVLSVGLAFGSMLACTALMALSVTGNSTFALAIVILPLMGAAAAVLGLVALARISQSAGRLGGRRLAILGLFVGLLGAVVQGSIVLGALRTYFDIRNTLVPHAAAFIEPLMQNDLAEARAALSTDADEEVLDSDLMHFAESVAECAGPNPHVTIQIGEMFRMVAAMRAVADPASTTLTSEVRPVQIVGSRGSCILFVVMDSGALRQKTVKIDDLLLVSLELQRAQLLRRSGDALEIAKSLGLAQDPAKSP